MGECVVCCAVRKRVAFIVQTLCSDESGSSELAEHGYQVKDRKRRRGGIFGKKGKIR
jgi:hypothetical protein